MKLSIVTTLYRSSGSLNEFYRRAVAAGEQITQDFELVLVNDGSPDDSLEKALHLHAADPRVVIVDLSRNFGHHHAIVAGLAHSRGEYVFLLDSDLEDEPEWLQRFWDTLKNSSGELDVVHGLQKQRRREQRFSGIMFYKIFNRVSNVQIPESPTTARLMTRRYVESVLDVPDRNVFMEGIFSWAGFSRKGVIVEVRARGESSYTSIRRIRLLIDSITSFSGAPLQIISLFGFVVWIISAVYGLILIGQKLLFPETVTPGYTSIIVSIWFIAGLLMMQLGIVGLYVSKVFNETKARPRFIVRAVHRKDK